MFPLGSVLLPGMPLPLRLFEPRYLAMLDAVLERDPQDFGVVLIERGSEVGGGDVRFGVGTMARVVQVERVDGLAALIAVGTGRFRVDRWGDEVPWPQADLTTIDDLTWDDALVGRLDEVERSVRTALSRASEFQDLRWSPDILLDDDPVQRCWQLAGIAPVAELDQVGLLAHTSVADLLDAIDELTADAVALLP